jgi:hypothetical protein
VTADTGGGIAAGIRLLVFVARAFARDLGTANRPASLGLKPDTVTVTLRQQRTDRFPDLHGAFAPLIIGPAARPTIGCKFTPGIGASNRPLRPGCAGWAVPFGLV